MNQAIDQIIANLNTELAEQDAQHLVNSIEWAKGRFAALVAYKASEDYANRSKQGAWGGQYQKMFDICGGKGWYNVLQYGVSKAAIEFITKNHASLIAKRNFNVAAKLERAGVTAVVESTHTRSNDGFNGVFHVMTDAGKKIITVNTIYAGGYHVQCLHTRTLIKVK